MVFSCVVQAVGRPFWALLGSLDEVSECFRAPKGESLFLEIVPKIIVTLWRGVGTLQKDLGPRSSCMLLLGW